MGQLDLDLTNVNIDVLFYVWLTGSLPDPKTISDDETPPQDNGGNVKYGTEELCNKSPIYDSLLFITIVWYRNTAACRLYGGSSPWVTLHLYTSISILIMKLCSLQLEQLIRNRPPCAINHHNHQLATLRLQQVMIRNVNRGLQ